VLSFSPVLVHGLKFQRRKQLINMWIKKKKNQTGLIFFFLFAVLEFKLRAYTLSHSTSPFL
jgi:hypothetical protein